jgi:hypothetical protein
MTESMGSGVGQNLNMLKGDSKKRMRYNGYFIVVHVIILELSQCWYSPYHCLHCYYLMILPENR